MSKKRVLKWIAAMQVAMLIISVFPTYPVYADIQENVNLSADLQEDGTEDPGETKPERMLPGSITEEAGTANAVTQETTMEYENNPAELNESGNVPKDNIPVTDPPLNETPDADTQTPEIDRSLTDAATQVFYLNNTEELPIVFEDDFTGDFSKWEAFQNAQFIKVEDGVLKTNGNGNAQFCTKQWYDGDLVCEFDFQIIKNSAGIQFNMANKTSNNYENTGYIANVSSAGKVDLIKGQSTGRKQLDQKTIPDFEINTWVHAKIEFLKEESQIRVYYNDMNQPLISIEDADPHTEGWLGFLGMYGEAQFDNVVVRGTVKDMGLKEVSDSIYILYKPLRDEQYLKLPAVPDGYSVSIVRTEPEGMIDTDGRILSRPVEGSQDQNVSVTLKITDDSSNNSVEKTLNVPISAVYTPPTMSQEEIEARMNDFKRNSFGLFDHYVAGRTCDQDGNVINDIDELADQLDVEQIARDAHDFGVEYMIFTVAHAGQRLLYPSEVSKRWRDDLRTGSGEKTYSDRDVIEELYQALESYGIDLILYICPEDGAFWSAEDKLHTGVDQCGQSAEGSHEIYDQFENELMDEIMKRYQGKIRGMWFDGFFIHYGQEHIGLDEERFHETLTAYDPSVILYGNVGADFQYQAFPDSPACNAQSLELYLLGQTTLNSNANINDARTWGANRHHICCTVGNATNNWWASMKDENNSKYSKENWFLYLIMQASVSEEGGLAVSFGNFPGKAKDQRNGNLWEGNIYETFTQMNRQYLDPVAESIKDKVPGKAYRSDHNSWLDREGWGVSMESADGKDVYLHIINYPEDSNTMTIPPTDDRSVLGGDAVLLKYDGTQVGVGFDRTAQGYRITLPEGESFHELDTVIKVQRIQKPKPDRRVVLPGADGKADLTGAWTVMNPFKGLNYSTYYGSRKDYIYTNKSDATFTRTFSGNRIEWYGVKAKDHGKAEIYIDGKKAAEIDARTEKREDNCLLFRSKKLENGEHTIQIRNKEASYLEIYALHALTEPDDLSEETGKDGLQALYNEKREITAGKYTNGSWTAFDRARADALAVLLDLSADEGTIGAATQKLIDSASGLKEKAGTKEISALLQQIQEAEKAEKKGWDSYTQKSWENFSRALGNARKIAEDAGAFTNTEVQQAREDLKKAVQELKEKPDRSPLEKALEAARAVDDSKYTDKSIQNLKALTAEAETLLKTSDEDLTQKQIQDLADKLQAAVKSLEKKPEDTGKQPDPNQNENEGREDKTDQRQQSNDSGNQDQSNSTDTIAQTAQTGDAAPVIPLILLLLLAAAGGGAVFYAKKYRSRRKGGETSD
ncbi:family 16 glycoside hydrolase [Diplocloster hominis]|uniref:family 16 glycoside hydrolase n=1 Tax=Diplocloster hominis TaxID=3079010 RepID=UPI0031B9FF18